ncbi:hypothetical protein [Pseudonocardia sp. H11422]|uniref:hypothetical protein n=1 Tax=Pseudonocardia sp. H11422 TaxID=2835866 RepID=UPI001BDC8EFB|nr:hypothetical protein [Pseudonocardia sp. H11422]
MTPQPTTVIAIGLAVLGAGCFAVAAVLQHRAVRATAGPGRGLSPGALRALLCRPGWLAGLALAGGGAGLHAVALALAPVSVVQPVGVLAVPFAVLLAARRSRTRPAPGVLGGVTVSVAGVAVFVGLAAGSAVSAPVSGFALLLAGALAAVVVLGLAALAARGSERLRCVACATAGAVAFGLVSVLLRALSQQIGSGAAGLLDEGVLGAGAGMAVALLVGGWLVQQAFASGPPEIVIACLTVLDPMVAVGLGVLLLGEGAGTGVATAAAMGAAALLAAAGVAALARHHPDAAGRAPAPGVPAPPTVAAPLP